MIYGIGTDICDISRIEKIYKKYGARFAAKILTEQELQHMPKMGKYAWLAKRFAAKEAFAKAVGTGFSGGLGFHDFAVLNNKKGAPEALCSECVQEKLPLGARVHVSLSDEKGYALAFIVIEQIIN